MKTTKLLSLVAFMLVPVLANAQWVHDATYPAHLDSISSVHGIAVDGEGKVWVQPFYASETIVMNRDVGADGIPDTLSTRVLYIYNADGSEASFSPLYVLNYADGSADTLGRVWYPDETDSVDGGSYEGYSGRGITADANGDIIVSSYNRLYKVDHTDGSGIAMVDPSAGCSLTEASTDAANNIYVGCVVGSAGPLMKFAPDLTGEEAVVTIDGSFSRDMQVSADGNTIWWAGYTNGSVFRYSRDDEFSSFGAADTVLVGMKSEVFDIHPVTGHLWAGSGSLNDVPASPWTPQTWYAFDVSTIGTENEIPVDSIRWAATTEDGSPFDAARPRGLDFSADGMTAYISTFSAPNSVQKHMKSMGGTSTKVTFNVNMAPLPDTLMSDHTVLVKGGVSGSDAAGLGNVIDWSANSLQMTHVDGDYWTASFDMTPGDTLNYKFWAGVDPETPLINGGEQGWESGGNNVFVLPTDAPAEVEVPMQWYELREAPYEMEEDSVTLLFKVNVGAQAQLGEFDPATDKVGIRGNPAFFNNPGDWSSSAFYLDPVGGSGDNIFYAGYSRIHKDSVANIEGAVGYKFVLELGDGTVTWESRDDRFINIPMQDSSAKWVYFNDAPPSNTPILNTTLNFEVNVGILEGLGYFNSSIDTVYVRGTFNGWSSENEMAFNSFSGTYEETGIPFNTTVGADVGYKYYIKWDASRDDETSENYLAGITHDGSGWEEPGVTGGGDRYFQTVDAADQPKRSEFFNGVEPKALMTSNNVDGGSMTVTFSIDMAPAVDNTSQPFNAANDSVYLFVDTPFFALTNGITVPGDGGSEWLTISDEERESLRFTDEDGDLVYELDLELQLPTLNHMGFRVAYGEPTSQDGSLFIHGSGFAAGRRHYQYVQPMVAQNGDVTWPSTFTMPTLTWKAEDLDWETPPDYQTPTSNEVTEDIANNYILEQNYPNPFNPTTNISFSLADAAPVKLTVYNLLGQEVATLIGGKVMTAGTHTVAFNASSLSSGVYIYRLEAGSFVSNKRMTLIK